MQLPENDKEDMEKASEMLEVWNLLDFKHQTASLETIEKADNFIWMEFSEFVNIYKRNTDNLKENGYYISGYTKEGGNFVLYIRELQ